MHFRYHYSTLLQIQKLVDTLQYLDKDNPFCPQALQELTTGFSACMTYFLVTLYLIIVCFLAYQLPNHSDYLLSLLRAGILSKLSVLISSPSSPFINVSIHLYLVLFYVTSIHSGYLFDFLDCCPQISVG